MGSDTESSSGEEEEQLVVDRTVTMKSLLLWDQEAVTQDRAMQLVITHNAAKQGKAHAKSECKVEC